MNRQAVYDTLQEFVTVTFLTAGPALGVQRQALDPRAVHRPYRNVAGARREQIERGRRQGPIRGVRGGVDSRQDIRPVR